MNQRPVAKHSNGISYRAVSGNESIQHLHLQSTAACVRRFQHFIAEIGCQFIGNRAQVVLIA